MCVERIEESDKQGLDLSSWTVAFTGSEVVRAATIDAFARAFASCGFRREAFYPCYGLAEATLMVTGPALLQGPETFAADRSGLAFGELRAGPADTAESVRLVACGSVPEGQELLVVQPGSTTLLPPGSVGKLLCRGPNVAQGYWQRPQETGEVFDVSVPGYGAGFLRAGDLGCLRDGAVFIVGRTKDLIIARGKNHHPGDLEATLDDALLAQEAPVGAICIFSQQVAGEHITVCVELRGARQRCEERAPAIAQICRRALSEHHGLTPQSVVFLRPGPSRRRRAASSDAVRCARRWLRVRSTSLRPTIGRKRRHHWRCPPRQHLRPTAPRSSAGLSTMRPANAASRHERSTSAHRSRASASPLSRPSPSPAALAEWVDRPVPATALWDHPNIKQLANSIMGEDRPDRASDSPVSERIVSPIAIVGMACRVPEAADLNSLWQMLVAGKRVTGEPPLGRPGGAALRSLGLQAGYLEDVECFDAAHFQIPADETRAMDPQQRALLEVSWTALESAGVDPSRFRGTNARSNRPRRRRSHGASLQDSG